MRIAIVGIASASDDRLIPYVKALESGFTTAGHQAEIIDSKSDAYLSMFDFIAIISEPVGLWSKIPAKIRMFLSRTGSIGGKRCMVALRKSGFMNGKALGRLMGVAESEGLVVVSAEIVNSPEAARKIALEAPVLKP